MDYLYLILLAIAVSIDGLIVGLTYGLRGMGFPRVSRVIIAAISSFLLAAALSGGQAAAAFMEFPLANSLGGIILVSVGVWTLANSWSCTSTDPSPYLELRLPHLGLVIAVLREPSRADLDRSGSISPREAWILGIALAMDAFGVGFGAGMGGTDLLILPLLVGLGMFSCLGLGYVLGAMGARKPVLGLSFVPGGLLVLMGFLKALSALP